MQLLLGAMGGFAIGGLVWSRYWHRFYRRLINRMLRAHQIASYLEFIQRMRARGFDVTDMEEDLRQRFIEPYEADQPMIPW